jgi:transposase InsO family protein
MFRGLVRSLCFSCCVPGDRYLNSKRCIRSISVQCTFEVDLLVAGQSIIIPHPDDRKRISTGQCKTTPFNFCFSIFCLVASAHASESANRCPDCIPNVTYKCGVDGITRHRRPPKTKEISRAEKSRNKRKNVSFTLSTNLSNRTNKHKTIYLAHESKRCKGKWTPDSGATVSVTNRIDLFETIDDHFPNKQVKVANNSIVDVMFTGSIRLNLQDKKGGNHSILLRNVCYSPHFSGNLLSVRELSKQHGINTVFGRKSYLVTPENSKIPIPEDDNAQYQLHAFAASNVDDPELWHRRFMHAGNDAMRRIITHKLQSLSGSKFDFSKCHSCLQGGARKLPFGTSTRHIRLQEKSKKRNRFTHFGQRISSDLCGPFPKAEDGSIYAIVFHDSAEKFIATYCLKDKERETILEAFQQFMLDHSSRLPNGIGLFHTDNGGEYQNADMEKFCEEISTKKTYTVPYLPQQNPYAERVWGDLLRKVRTTLVDGTLPEKFWPDLMRQATLIHNIIPDDDGTSPYERVFGEIYSYSRLHVPGCLCYYLVPKRYLESKLSPRALPAVYLSEDPDRNGHKLYVPSLRKFVSAYHVVFNERRYYDFSRSFPDTHVRFPSNIHTPTRMPSAIRDDREDGRHEDNEVENDPNENDVDRELPLELRPDYQPSKDNRHGTDETWSENHCENSKCFYPRGHDGLCSDLERSGTRRRTPIYANSIYPKCASASCIFHHDHAGECIDDDGELTESCESVQQVRVHEHIDDDDTSVGLFVVTDESTGQTIKVDAENGDIKPPKSDQEAEKGPLAPRWWESRTKEYTDLVSHNTWELVSRFDERVRGRKPTKSRWVYTIKYNRDGTIERFKSRFVVCGYSQRQGIDYERAFSATLRATTFRIMLAAAAGKQMRLEHFDVTNAFTQALMDDVELYVEPPKGFEEWETVNGKQYSKLLLLRKALYGTKQASRLWQETLRACFLSNPTSNYVSNHAGCSSWETNAPRAF